MESPGTESACSAQGPNGFQQPWFEDVGAAPTCSCNICLHSSIPGKGEQSSRNLKKTSNYFGIELIEVKTCFNMMRCFVMSLELINR